jgi:SAM-dependent methyltransferase
MADDLAGNTAATGFYSMRTATKDDVLACYRVLLGRQPESEEVVNHHLRNNPSIEDLLRLFSDTQECQRMLINRRAGDNCYYYTKAHIIDTDGTPAEVDQLFERVRKTWRSLGSSDPHFSVLTNPLYHSKNWTPQIEEDFYKTGQIEADVFVKACERNGIALTNSGTIVELGCGVGRLAEHLAPNFDRYVGIDISETHLSIAKARCESVSLPNVEYVLLPSFIESTRTFDVFFSLIVLQHNPPPIIVHLLEQMLARLNPGGVAFFQLPSALFDYDFQLKDYLRDVDAGDMEMHALPQKKVFEIFARYDCRPLEVIFDGKAGPLGFSYTYLCQKS